MSAWPPSRTTARASSVASPLTTKPSSTRCAPSSAKTTSTNTPSSSRCSTAFAAISSANSLPRLWRPRLHPLRPEWYPYFMRRLAERPANVLFLAKNFSKLERSTDDPNHFLSIASHWSPSNIEVVILSAAKDPCISLLLLPSFFAFAFVCRCLSSVPASWRQFFAIICPLYLLP